MARVPDEHMFPTRTVAFILAILALALLAAGLSAASHPDNEDANQGGTGVTDWDDDWELVDGDDLEYGNQTINITGNLTIAEGGRLVLRNVTLILHGELLSAKNIRLNDGAELVITDLDGDPETPMDRSEVRGYLEDTRYYFKAYEGSSLTIKNSRIKNCGRLFNEIGIQAGLYIATETITIENVEITKGFCGIFIDGVDVTISGCDIHDNEWHGVYVDNRADPEFAYCKIEDNNRTGVVVQDQSEPTLRHCSVRGNDKGVVVDGAYLIAWDCDIKNNDDLDIELPSFSQADLYNCSVTPSPFLKVVLVDNSSLFSTNGNFNLNKVTLVNSLFLYQQFLTVRVTWGDSLSTPIHGVYVKVEDIDMTVVDEGYTGEDGLTTFEPIVVMQYNHKTPPHKDYDYNPFRVTVNFKGIEQTEPVVDLKGSSVLKTFQYPDTEPPVVEAPTVPTGDVDRNMTLSGSRCTDNVAIGEWNWSFEEFGLTVYLDGETVTYAFQQAKTYTVTLKVTDTSGNSDNLISTTTFTVVVEDRTPPVADAGANMTVSQGSLVTFDGSNSTDNVGISTWTWSFTYGPPNEKVLYSLSSDVTPIQTFTFEIPGTYIIALMVEDIQGLQHMTSITLTVEDTEPPITQAALTPQPGPDWTFSEIVDVTFTVQDDNPEGTVDIYYSINDGEWQVITGALKLQFGGDLEHGDGVYTIAYYGIDSVGNTEDVKTVTAFTVDATPPTITDLDPAVSPTSTTDATYIIRGRTEPGATLTINGVDVVVGGDGSFSHEVDLNPGENPFMLIAEDDVGNIDSEAVTLDRTDYKTEKEDGGISMALIGVAILVVIVVLLLAIYVGVIRKR